MAGVTLSARQARFAWQAWRFQDLHRCPRKLGDAPLHVTWHFQDLHRCPRKLGDELGRIDAAAFDVAGVALSARLDLRGRRGTFRTFIDVRGSSATNWVGLTPLHLTWQA